MDAVLVIASKLSIRTYQEFGVTVGLDEELAKLLKAVAYQSGL